MDEPLSYDFQMAFCLSPIDQDPNLDLPRGQIFLAIRGAVSPLTPVVILMGLTGVTAEWRIVTQRTNGGPSLQ